MVTCNYCDKPARLVSGRSIYYDIPELHNNNYWVCKDCDARVRCHRNNKSNKPIGILCNKELRRLKRIINGKIQGRRKKGLSYKESLISLGIERTHDLNKEQCKRIIDKSFNNMVLRRMK